MMMMMIMMTMMMMILDSEENVALHQPSLQSGSFLDNLPHLAVDGGEF